MAIKSWIALPIVACCTGATIVLPGTQHFYSVFWASFTTESLANRVGIVASLVGLFGVPISAVITTALFWRGRTMEALRVDRDNAVHLRVLADEETRKAEAKAEKLKADLRAVEEGAPGRFLMSAMLSDSGPSTKPNVIPILKKGLLACAEPLADACRLLARKLLAQDEAGDFQLAERAAKIATVLVPNDLVDREVANIIAERQAVEAVANGTYDPFDPRFEPVLIGGEDDPAGAEERVDAFCAASARARAIGDYFTAHRLAVKARAVSTFVPSPRSYFRSSLENAHALRDLGRFEQALKTIDAFADDEVLAVGDDHQDVFETRFLRVQVLSGLGRYEEALKAIDDFADRLAQALGDEHPRVFATLALRAQVLTGLGRYDEALKAIDAFIDHQSHTLGADHPEVFATLFLRAQVLSGLGRYGEALEAIDAFAEDEAHALGDNHPNAQQTRAYRLGILTRVGAVSELPTPH